MLSIRYNFPVTLASLIFAVCLPASAGVPEVRVQARKLVPGEAVLFVVTEQDPKTAPKGTFAGKDLSFFPSGPAGTWLAFSGIDLDQSTGPAKLAVDLRGADGTPRHWDQDLSVSFKAYPTRHLTVDPKFVEPPPDLAARAEAEGKRLAAIFATVTPERLWSGSFASPIPGAVVSRFGQRSVFNGVPKAPHAGADLRAAKGVPVKAPARGRVVHAEENYYPGNIVVLDHGWGVYSSYSHLSRIDVRVGDVVNAGDVLGAVGATGRVTGPHLHWAAKVGGGRVDPFSLVALPLDDFAR